MVNTLEQTCTRKQVIYRGFKLVIRRFLAPLSGDEDHIPMGLNRIQPQPHNLTQLALDAVTSGCLAYVPANGKSHAQTPFFTGQNTQHQQRMCPRLPCLPYPLKIGVGSQAEPTFHEFRQLDDGGLADAALSKPGVRHWSASERESRALVGDDASWVDKFAWASKNLLSI